MKSKIHTVKFHSSAPEVLQSIDAIGMAQVAAYNIITQNDLMSIVMRSSGKTLPPALKQVVQENRAVLIESFTLWANSIDCLCKLRQDIVSSNNIDASEVIGSPANVAEQILEELATDTEFDRY